MTWSIIARDKATGSFGIAVATKFFAAGARVPFIAAGVGAIATQALVNPFYGTKGLLLLRDGMTADAVVKTLIAGDDGRDHRQQVAALRPIQAPPASTGMDILPATVFPLPATCLPVLKSSTPPRRLISQVRRRRFHVA